MLAVVGSGMQSLPWVSFYPRTARGCLSTVVGLRNAGLPLPPTVFSSSPVRTTCSRPLCSLSSNRAHTQEVQPVVGKPVPKPKNRWTGIVGQGRAGWQVVVVAGALLCACLVVALLRADLPNVSLGPTAPS